MSGDDTADLDAVEFATVVACEENSRLHKAILQQSVQVVTENKFSVFTLCLGGAVLF